MVVKRTRLVPLVVVFIILIGLKIRVPKANFIDEERDVIRSKMNEVDQEVQENQEDQETEDKDENKIITQENETLEAVFAYSPLSDKVIDRITGISYKENEEVKLEDLAYIQIKHWGFDDKEHVGELIVHTKVAEEVVDIFRELYEAKYPIEKIKLIDEYDANDELSMSDNNTSAFCYREITGNKGKLSNHSYGVAIDINPIQNSYIKNDIVLPEAGKEYLDRDNIRKGMIVEGDVCYNAFKSRGWTWGGDWKSLKDYQHFEIY